MVKRVLDAGLVVVLADHLEIASEGLNQVWGEGDLVFRQEAAVEEVEDREQKDRLVRSLVRAAFVAAEVVKALQPLLPCLFRRHSRHGTKPALREDYKLGDAVEARGNGCAALRRRGTAGAEATCPAAKLNMGLLIVRSRGARASHLVGFGHYVSEEPRGSSRASKPNRSPGVAARPVKLLAERFSRP